MANKTIIQFVPSLHDGGGETLASNYALTLKLKGFTPIMFVLYKNSNTANSKKIDNDEIKVVSVYNKWNFATRIINKVFGKYIVSRRLKNIIKKENPCAIHAHMIVLHYLAPIADFISRRNINLLYTCHSIPERYFANKNQYEADAARILLRKSKLQIIALHEQMRRSINEIFNISNTIVVNNGVDIHRYSDVKENKESIRSSLGIPNNAFVLGHVGRFVDVKNHDYLVDIFNNTKEQNNDAFLLLVGSGGLESYIRKKLDDNRLQDSYLILSDRADVERILKAMDVYVFPSKYEGMPISLIEAQAAGLHCVVSNRVTDSAIVTENCSLLSIEDNPSKWTDAILKMSNRITARGSLNDFDLSKTVDDLILLYTK